MSAPKEMTVEVSGHTLPVLGLSSNGLIVPVVPELIGNSLVARITASKGNQVWKGDILVRMKLAGSDGTLVLTGGREKYHRLLSVLKWHTGRTTSFADQFADSAPIDEHQSSAGFAHGAQLAGLGLVALCLILLIFQLATQRSTSAFSQIAFVAVPGQELDAHTAGQIVYVKGTGRIEKGEFYAALRTSQGFPKFLEASRSGEVSAQAADPQDYVRKATPVVRLSSPDAKPYVTAFVKPADVVKALNAAEATVEFRKSGRTFSVPVDETNYVNSTPVFTDADGKALAEIKLRIPEGVDVPVDEPALVEFRSSVWGIPPMPFRWLTDLSTLLSQG